MATNENKIKNVVHAEETGCTFRVERGPSSEGRAWGMADILTDAFAGHAEDHWINVVTSRAGGAFAEVRSGVSRRARRLHAIGAPLLHPTIEARRA